MGAGKVWMCLAMIAVSLAIVKWISISSGPTSDDAKWPSVLRSARLFEAKKSQRGVDTPKLNNEGALNLAWAALGIMKTISLSYQGRLSTKIHHSLYHFDS
jgi:hypothetical protein